MAGLLLFWARGRIPFALGVLGIDYGIEGRQLVRLGGEIGIGRIDRTGELVDAFTPQLEQTLAMVWPLLRGERAYLVFPK